MTLEEGKRNLLPSISVPQKCKNSINLKHLKMALDLQKGSVLFVSILYEKAFFNNILLYFPVKC